MTFAIGISGATGVTGEVTLRVLEERAFPVGELRLFASRSSAGQSIRWKGRDHAVEALEDGRFAGLDVVISATSAAIAREWAPRMVEAGAVVIDQSSAFRLDPAVPLVVPEINAEDLKQHAGIIAGPNCTTAVAVMATKVKRANKRRMRADYYAPEPEPEPEPGFFRARAGARARAREIIKPAPGFGLLVRNCRTQSFTICQLLESRHSGLR